LHIHHAPQQCDTTAQEEACEESVLAGHRRVDCRAADDRLRADGEVGECDADDDDAEQCEKCLKSLSH
jgi:hypothetical protein